MTNSKNTIITADNLYAAMLVYKRWINNLIFDLHKRLKSK